MVDVNPQLAVQRGERDCRDLTSQLVAVQGVIVVIPVSFFKFCPRRDGGFTGLLNEIANSDAEGL